MSDPVFPGKRHVKVPEDWFNDNNMIAGNEVLGVEQGGIFHVTPEQGWVEVSHPIEGFMPQGILIGEAQDNDTDATYAVINGWLHGEALPQLDTYRLAIGVVHPLAFAGMVFNNTTARKIKFIGA